MMIFFKITIFVNYNANDELVSICDEKKKKKNWMNLYWNTKVMILDGRFRVKLKLLKQMNDGIVIQ